MVTDRGSGSLCKTSDRQPVVNGADERLLQWLTAPKPVDVDMVFIEIDLSPDEAVGPQRIHREMMSEDNDPAVVVGAPEKHDAAVGRRLKVQVEIFGYTATRTEGVTARREARASRVDVPGRPVLERCERVVMKPCPDLALPAPIEVLDAILKPMLARRREDRDDVELQAQPHDATDDISVLMRPLKPRVVVKLRVVGEPHVAPVLEDAIEGAGGGVRVVGPGPRITALQRDDIEDFNLRSLGNDEPFDEVPAVEFGLTGRTRGQIPSGRRCGPPNPVPAVQGAMSDQHPMNRAFAEMRAAFGLQLASNRGGTVFPEVALLQGVAQLQNPALECRRGAAYPLGDMRAIGPADPVQALMARARHPTLYGAQPDPKASRDGALRKASPNGGDQRAAQGDQVFLSCCHSYVAAAYPKPGRGSCRSCGRPERVHKLLGTRGGPRFPQLPPPSQCVQPDPDPLSAT